VIDALKLERPVLAGHSIAGEESSSAETRHASAAFRTSGVRSYFLGCWTRAVEGGTSPFNRM
jgi:hypothetical protein